MCAQINTMMKGTAKIRNQERNKSKQNQRGDSEERGGPTLGFISPA